MSYSSDSIEESEKIKKIKYSKSNILPHIIIIRIIREALILRYEEQKKPHIKIYKNVINYLNNCIPIEENLSSDSKIGWFCGFDDFEPQFFPIFEWANIVKIKTIKNNVSKYPDIYTYKKLGTLIGCLLSYSNRDLTDCWKFCSNDESYIYYYNAMNELL